LKQSSAQFSSEIQCLRALIAEDRHLLCGRDYYYLFIDRGTQFPENEKKLRYAIQKKYKNHAGINLTPPPPSQNSHAVRWHCTAESERRVAEIKS